MLLETARDTNIFLFKNGKRVKEKHAELEVRQTGIASENETRQSETRQSGTSSIRKTETVCYAMIIVGSLMFGAKGSFYFYSPN